MKGKCAQYYYRESYLKSFDIFNIIIQHRCVTIFKDKNQQPTGFALGSVEGRVAIHYINPTNP